ncbi:MAG: site-specific integrase [Marinibacterium profundimaris]
MRIGEILALTAADIDLAKGRIRVNKTVVKGAGNLPEIQNATKTDAGRRAIPIPPRLRAALEPRVGHLRGDALILPDPGSTARSAPYRVTTVSGVVFNQAKKVGVPSGTHCARHNYASHMLTQKTPVHIVSRLLGHSSPQVTLESYAWVLDDQDLDSAVLNVFGGGLTVVGGSEKEAG